MGSRWAGRRAVAVLCGAALLGTGCTEGSKPAPNPAPTGSAAVAWQAWEPAPSRRTEVVAAVAGTRIHLLGGFRADGGTVATVEVLDTTTRRWERGADLPVAVNHAMAATVDGTVYLFGGYLADGKPTAAVHRLEAGGWRTVAPMPQPRAAGTAVVAGRAVHVAGGVGPAGLAREMLVYDAANDRWSAAPGPPTPREHLGGAGFGGRVYTVGGRTGGLDSNLGAFEVYDPTTGRWSALPALPTARGGLAAAVTCTGRLIAVGGEERATFAEAEMFDVAAGIWSALPPMPTARHGLGVVALGTTLVTLAGGPRPGLHVADTVEAIELAALGACPAPAG